MEYGKMSKWLIVNRRGEVLIDTDDLDHAWSICEQASRCGQALTVTSNAGQVKIECEVKE